MNIQSSLVNKLFLAAVSLVVCIGFILMTDPRNVVLPLIVLPFILVGFTIYQLASATFLVGGPAQNKYLSRIVPLNICFITVGLLLLQTLHQLTWRDTLLLMLFSLLLWLYIDRADFLQK